MFVFTGRLNFKVVLHIRRRIFLFFQSDYLNDLEYDRFNPICFFTCSEKYVCIYCCFLSFNSENCNLTIVDVGLNRKKCMKLLR